MKFTKIAIVTSRGGHLYQLWRLRRWWKQYDRFWVTFHGEDSEAMLAGEKVFYAYYPESRNILNAIRNLFYAYRILNKEKPTLLISCGAGIAPPFFYAAKLLGIRMIFIEPYDFVCYPSLSGRLVEPITDIFLVQHKTQLRFFQKAVWKGSTL